MCFLKLGKRPSSLECLNGFLDHLLHDDASGLDVADAAHGLAHEQRQILDVRVKPLVLNVLFEWDNALALQLELFHQPVGFPCIVYTSVSCPVRAATRLNAQSALTSSFSTRSGRPV